MISGRETPALTMTWALYELSRNRGTQNRVREEINAARAHAAQRGNGELVVADLDSRQSPLLF
jgi:cytochrome P450